MDATPGAGKTIAMFSAATYLKSNRLRQRWVVNVASSGSPTGAVDHLVFRWIFALNRMLQVRSLPSSHCATVTRAVAAVTAKCKALKLHHPSATNDVAGEDLSITMGGAKYKLFATGMGHFALTATPQIRSYDDLGS